MYIHAFGEFYLNYHAISPVDQRFNVSQVCCKVHGPHEQSREKPHRQESEPIYTHKLLFCIIERLPEFMHLLFCLIKSQSTLLPSRRTRTFSGRSSLSMHGMRLARPLSPTPVAMFPDSSAFFCLSWSSPVPSSSHVSSILSSFFLAAASFLLLS